MDGLVVAVIVAAVGLTVLRVYAARRVAARQGQFVWLMFPATLIGPLAIAWAAVQLLPRCSGDERHPGRECRWLRGLRWCDSTSACPAPCRPRHPARSIPVTVTDAYAEHVTAMLGFILLGGLVAMVALLVWAVSQAGH